MRTHSSMRRLARHRRGASALEFALVVFPFLMLLLGLMEVGYDFFVQSMLDNAVAAAARSVQVGTTQGTSGESGAALAAAAVCPALAGVLDCSRVVVGVAPIATGSDYYRDSPVTWGTASSVNGTVCTGSPGQLMLLSAWYVGPTFLGTLVPAFSTVYQGSLVHITSASIPFTNELFTGGQTAGSSC